MGPHPPRLMPQLRRHSTRYCNSFHNLTTLLRESHTESLNVLKEMLCLHFFKKIPVGDDLQLFKDKEDATADEKGLVLSQRLVQEEEVAFAGGGERSQQGHRTESRNKIASKAVSAPTTCVQFLVLLHFKRSQIEKDKYSTLQLWLLRQIA